MLELNHISKTFNPGTVNEKRALSDLSLFLKPGDFATIIGSNGAGKSTLFNRIYCSGWTGYYLCATAYPLQKYRTAVSGPYEGDGTRNDH